MITEIAIAVAAAAMQWIRLPSWRLLCAIPAAGFIVMAADFIVLDHLGIRQMSAHEGIISGLLCGAAAGYFLAWGRAAFANMRSENRSAANPRI